MHFTPTESTPLRPVEPTPVHVQPPHERSPLWTVTADLTAFRFAIGEHSTYHATGRGETLQDAIEECHRDAVKSFGVWLRGHVDPFSDDAKRSNYGAY